MDKDIKTLQDKSEDGKANMHFSHQVKQTINTNLVFTQGSFANGAGILGHGSKKMHFCPAVCTHTELY